MPDMDSPQISGILEQGSPTGGVVIGLHLSKRPRDDGSPLPGKRGRGENGNISLTLQIPSAIAPSAGNAPQQQAQPPPPPPPLCESPSKMNQAQNATPSTPNACAPFSGGSGGTAKRPDKDKATAVEATAPAAPVSGAGCPTARRKTRLPVAAAPPSLGATDPIFHAALLRLLHRRDGRTCPEALGWRWSGDNPSRFDHWPCALHPSVMDLLACVSASEERVVLTGCDVKRKGCGDEEDDDQPQTPRTPRETAWRAPLPRAPAQRGPPAAAAVAAAEATPNDGSIAVPSTPVASPRAVHQSARTPLSALRRPGSSRRSSNRVRFSTHDMSVVDTPDPARGGSEEGMISALGGLESILEAAEQLRALTLFGGSGSEDTASRGGGRVEERHYEGYFDRFSAAGEEGQRNAAEEHVASAAVAVDAPALACEQMGISGQEGGSSGDGHGDDDDQDTPAASQDSEEEEEAFAAAETKSAREDAVAFVDVMDEIASGHSAPEEVALAGGWGPEHSNAAAFYAKELALLCGVDGGMHPVAAAGAAGAAGSRLRVRYLDVLSCLVRYNLKLLLNVCLCEIPDGNGVEDDTMEAHNIAGEVDSDDASDTGDDFSSPPSLSVIVPGRAALLRGHGMAGACWESSTTAQAKRGCGCVTVLDGTGALEFNTEDVAALLTLALARVRPFMPLAARITAAAEEAEWDGGDHHNDDAIDTSVWAAVLQYTSECRGAVTAAAAAGGASATDLFPAALMTTATASAGAEAPSGSVVADLAISDSTANEDASASAIAVTRESAAVAAAAAAAAAADAEDLSGLTVDEAADLLEYVAASRFIAQLIAEPVVAVGISAGRWSGTELLADQVRKLADAEEKAVVAIAACDKASAQPAAPALSNALCLGALADVQGLGATMAQQARYARALESPLKVELRRAMRRGHGSRQRRIKSRLHQTALPEVFSFPMITPCCSLGPGDNIV